MGGHAAWKKRVARGELAKGLGGAIMRHRPHLGRKGKDLILNRKGHIGGGNPKKKKKIKKNKDKNHAGSDENHLTNKYLQWKILLGIATAYCIFYGFVIHTGKQ